MAFPRWKAQAEAHWKEFQPTRYRRLKESGRLNDELEKAVELTYSETSQLEESGMQPDEAFQMVREKYLFPPEEQTTPA
jgi:hypothetical protein